MNGAHNCSDQDHLLSIWRAYRSEWCPVWIAACSLPIMSCYTVRMYSRWQVKEVSKNTWHRGLSEGIPHVLAVLCSPKLKVRRYASFVLLANTFDLQCIFYQLSYCLQQLLSITKTFLPEYIFGKKFPVVL